MSNATTDNSTMISNSTLLIYNGTCCGSCYSYEANSTCIAGTHTEDFLCEQLSIIRPLWLITVWSLWLFGCYLLYMCIKEFRHHYNNIKEKKLDVKLSVLILMGTLAVSRILFFTDPEPNTPSLPVPLWTTSKAGLLFNGILIKLGQVSIQEFCRVSSTVLNNLTFSFSLLCQHLNVYV